MNRTAYLVLAINEDTDLICGCGIFSEESPTVMGNTQLVCLLMVDGKDYQDARDKLVADLEFWDRKWHKKLYYRYNNA